MQNSATKYIADATAFYAGLVFKDVIVYTTPQVIDEVKHIKKGYALIDTLIDAGIINIIEPEDDYLGKAKELAEKSGELDKLSDADLSIIALALALRYEVITDDYAIINILKQNGIKVKNIINKRFKKVGRWIKYCKGCNVSYKDGNICKICGNKLVRKLVS
ncbi:MAG: DNA-binding protein [Candidatus Nitrosocaldaceae archaeon]|nr:MAG: DNA-binding protein [Candidatus Nitrosocaldaceae archaeon]